MSAAASGRTAPPPSLDDSTRTTAIGGSTISDCTVRSDLTSDITSTSDLRGSLNGFELHHLIGSGQFSQVWAAKHRQTGRMVSLKKVQIFEIMDSKVRNDCINEVKILQSLEHPHVVKYIDSFIEENELIIVLEWAEKGDLKQLLSSRKQNVGQPFTEQEVWMYFVQICDALKHMHARRMMHRDLKPSNILVTAAGELKIGDLGLSRYFSSKTMVAQSVVGTPYYMSPECIRGTPYDWSSDAWSLGCLLYEIATLCSPFHKEGLTFYTLGKLICNCQYEPFPPHTPGSVKTLVECILVPDPKSRPPVALAHEYALALLHGRPLPPGPWHGGSAAADDVEMDEC
eukprot:jgi/Tetstr1/459836/TSEL_005185.t1